jgi:hypothetical protein
MNVTTLSLLDIPLFRRLEGCDRVLLCGAGGGFDVFTALPLMFALRRAGKEVYLANLTFTYLGGTDAEYLMPALARVTAQTSGEDRYSPERYLCEWLDRQSPDICHSIYCFEKTGVPALTAAYRHLVRTLDVDGVVLVDGGTDILMRGDEAGLGTPAEDISSLAAAYALDTPVRIVTCLGFGIDAFHGVCHAQFLENVAALAADDGYLGAHSLTPGMEEADRYRAAVEYVHERMPARQSIVNGSIVSALESRFGDYHRTDRTRSSELFINPLMCIYFSFELAAVARRCLYLEQLGGTSSIFEVQAIIDGFRKTVPLREYKAIPV